MIQIGEIKMLGFNAFRGLKDMPLSSMNTGEKLSLGAHNSLLQLANVGGYTNPTAWGAAAGAAYGAADGAFSYDGSLVGGAFHGAMLGAAGGAGLKFSANTYARGAVNGFKPHDGASAFKSATGGGDAGPFSNAWKANKDGRDGKQIGAFQWGNFGAGF